MDDLVDDTSPNLGADLDGEGYYALDLQNIPDLAASGPGLWFDGNNDVITLGGGANLTFGDGALSIVMLMISQSNTATQYLAMGASNSFGIRIVKLL